MTERADISLQENQTLDIYDEFDKIYDQDDETLLIASIMDLAFLEVLGDLGEESRQSVIGEWVPDEAAGLAFSIPENADTWYRRIREKVASWPSQKVANALKERLPNNGREFCEAIQYCRKKSKAEDIKLNVKQFLKDATIIGGFGGVVWAKFKLGSSSDIETALEDGADIAEGELLVTAGEAIGTVIDIGTDILTTGLDTVVPLSLVVRVTKSSLDKLCPCCEKCEGKGKNENGSDCDGCGGLGSKVPFPMD